MAVLVDENYNVTVTPESWLTKLRQYLPKEIRDELYSPSGKLIVRSMTPAYNPDFLDETSQDDYIYNASQRLYNILASEPNSFPSISSSPRWIDLILPAKKGMSKRPNIDIFGNMYNINSIGDLIAERSHDFLKKYGKNSRWSLSNIWKTITRDDENYSDLDHYEYETHGGKDFLGFEGELSNYFYKGDTPTLFKFKNGSKLIPKKRFIK